MATQPANIDCHKPILIDAQETYRTLINSIRDYAIYLLDPTGIVLTWNTGAERIKGYSANEIIGHSFTCFYPEEALKRGYPEFEMSEASRTGRFEGEGFRVRKDGSQFWAGLVITAIYGPNRELIGFSKVVRDLTEQRHTEERLGDSVKELKDIKFALDQSTIVAFTDKQGTITYVNDAFCKISKYSEQELLGQNHRIINSGHHPHEFFINMWKTIAKGQVWKGEIKNRAKDGSYYWVDTTIVPLKDDQGKPEQYIAIRHDITNRKQVEEELRASLKEVADIKFALDQSTIVAITDRKGDITYVNDAFCRISKYSEQELLGQNHRIINSGHHPHEFFINMWKTIAKGQVWKGEIKNRAKDGSYYWVDTTLVPFVDSNGKPYQYAAVRHDITGRKKLELELEQAKEAAEEANKKKSQFIANMSHELRTPLNAVISYSQMLKQGIAGAINEKQHKYANNIEVSGKHLLDMVNDILDIAKIEAGKIQLAFQQVEVKPLITDLQEVLAGMAEQKKVKLGFSTDSDLVRIMADPARLRQIFFNLISNAIKFNRENGYAYIRLYCSDDQQWIIGEVEDTGIGIPKNKIGELFTQFYQVDSSTSRAHEGTGLGLALTRHLVQLHGGTISVESEEGKGSKFTFKIPMSPLRQSELKQSAIHNGKSP
jgi:PAS domain S-box-containing protein